MNGFERRVVVENRKKIKYREQDGAGVPAGGGVPVIQTRREYVHVGSDRSIHAAHGLVHWHSPSGLAIMGYSSVFIPSFLG